MRPNRQPALCDRLWQIWSKQCAEWEQFIHKYIQWVIRTQYLFKCIYSNITNLMSAVVLLPALCGCCVWTFWVLTDTGPVWDGHYLWPCSGYCQWPRKEMQNLYAGGGIKSRGTKMSVLINLHGGSKSMTKSCFFFFSSSAKPARWMYPKWYIWEEE